jgi:hypothetical protein
MNKLVIILGGALFLSLAGNLFMAGYMIGDRASGGAEVTASARSGERKPDWKKRDEELRKKLSDADRKIFEAVKAGNRETIQELKKKLEAAHDRVKDVEHGDPVDQAALEAALRDEAAAKSEFLTAIRAMRKEIADKLSPEGRAAMEKSRPLREKREGRRGERRRGEFMERLRERRNGPGMTDEKPAPFENRDVPLKSGERPDFPVDIPQPPPGEAPPHPPKESYDNHEGHSHPPGEDCGGCEVPPGADDGEPLVPPE